VASFVRQSGDRVCLTTTAAKGWIHGVRAAGNRNGDNRQRHGVVVSLVNDKMNDSKYVRNLLLRKIWFIDAQANCYFSLDGKKFVF